MLENIVNMQIFLENAVSFVEENCKNCESWKTRILKPLKHLQYVKILFKQSENINGEKRIRWLYKWDK